MTPIKEKNKQSLWTRDFVFITLSSILSIIAGEAINLPISLLVFAKTQSTLLSAFVMVCGFLPDMLISVIAAPLIDAGNKKKWIVLLDILLAALYALMALITNLYEFKYLLYVLFSFITATISVLYRLTYTAWYPDMIPNGFEQKGYAISGGLYPFIIIVMSPVSTFLYTKLSISTIFVIVTGLLVVSVFIEAQITYTAKVKKIGGVREWYENVKEGLKYIKKESGIRNIYVFMSIMCGTGEGTGILIQAFYQTNPLFSVTMLGFLKSAEMLGRVISSFLQYKIVIPARKRYGVTCFVYVFYQLADMILLFTGYGCMLINRFTCGGLGTMSATIRETAAMSYLPANMRARVSAFFEMIIAGFTMVFYLLAGVLGQVMPYKYGVLLLGSFTMIALFVFIIIPRQQNRKVYEAERAAS